MRIRFCRALIYFCIFSTALVADDLTVHLARSLPVQRKTASYWCDANGTLLGLPAAPFKIEYIRSGSNDLAVLPIAGESLIFAGVSSGSGARYAAGSFIWWEAAGRSITLTGQARSREVVSSCRILR